MGLWISVTEMNLKTHKTAGRQTGIKGESEDGRAGRGRQRLNNLTCMQLSLCFAADLHTRAQPKLLKLYIAQSRAFLLCR